MVRTRSTTMELDRLDRIERILEWIVEALPNLHRSGTEPVQQDHPGNCDARQGDDRDLLYLYKMFLDLEPSTFDGTKGAMAAEEWLLEMNRIFSVMVCTEEQKVACATYMFKGAAHKWWLLENAREPNMNWQRFIEVFNEKYFLQEMRNQKIAEFLVLQQGGMTVEEYEAKFTKLARFAPNVINTDSLQALKFEEGLRWAIKDRVRPLRLATYNEVVETAKIIELSGEEFAKRRGNQRPGNSRDRGRGSSFFKPGTSSRGLGTGPNQRRVNHKNEGIPKCPICQRFHRGPCRKNTNTCYNCGQIGHFMRNCPKGGRTMTSSTTASSDSVTRPQTRNEQQCLGRVFSSTPRDVQATTLVVASTFTGSSKGKGKEV